MAKSQTHSEPQSPAKTRRAAKKPQQDGQAAGDLAATLSYNEARTALELSLAELQASDLDVEAMAGLYKRAEAYAERCEALLQQVEQEVLLWSAEDPTAPPTPYAP